MAATSRLARWRVFDRLLAVFALLVATALLPAPVASAATSGAVHNVAVEVGSPPLIGTLTLPVGRGPFPAVLLLAGSGPEDQNEDIGSNHPLSDIAKGLAAKGVASLRYNKRTYQYPESINPATFTATDEYVPDALAGLTLLRHQAEIDPDHLFVLGQSQGGTFAPKVAAEAPYVAGVILLAAASEPFGPDLVRQETYLSTLPGQLGQQAKASLRQVKTIAQQIGCSNLAKDSPTSTLFGGTGPAYWLDLCHYQPVATARALHQPILVLQGGRDYQVTVADDLRLWEKGLAGKHNVSIRVFPADDHLFLSGTGRPTPAEYQVAGHVDPNVIATIATFVDHYRYT